MFDNSDKVFSFSYQMKKKKCATHLSNLGKSRGSQSQRLKPTVSAPNDLDVVARLDNLGRPFLEREDKQRRFSEGDGGVTPW